VHQGGFLHTDSIEIHGQQNIKLKSYFTFTLFYIFSIPFR